MKNVVYAIVVTYNGAKWVDKCFGSLVNSSIPLKILAIDNSSTDNTPNIIREKFPSVEVIETGSNLGFGKANNIGLKRVLDEKADFAFLLNQDAWVENNTIEETIRVYDRNTQYGIISPLEFSGNEIDLDYAFREFYIKEDNCKGLENDLSIDNLKEIYSCNFINASGWLLPRLTVLKVGGFDPLFYHYGEDSDYIRRVLYHSKLIGITPRVRYFHDRPQGLSVKTKSKKRIIIHNLGFLKDINNHFLFNLKNVLIYLYPRKNNYLYILSVMFILIYYSPKILINRFMEKRFRMYV